MWLIGASSLTDEHGELTTGSNYEADFIEMTHLHPPTIVTEVVPTTTNVSVGIDIATLATSPRAWCTSLDTLVLGLVVMNAAHNGRILVGGRNTSRKYRREREKVYGVRSGKMVVVICSMMIHFDVVECAYIQTSFPPRSTTHLSDVWFYETRV